MEIASSFRDTTFLLVYGNVFKGHSGPQWKHFRTSIFWTENHKGVHPPVGGKQSHMLFTPPVPRWRRWTLQKSRFFSYFEILSTIFLFFSFFEIPPYGANTISLFLWYLTYLFIYLYIYTEKSRTPKTYASTPWSVGLV